MPLLREMRPAELREAVERDCPLLLPAGCVECHGNHLPLGCDTIVAESVAFAVADRIGAIVGPTIDYGPTGYAVSGPDRGTVDTPPAAFYAYARAVLAGLVRLGFQRIYIIIHHQGPEGPEGTAFHFGAVTYFNELSRTRGEGWWGERKPEPYPTIQVLPTIPPNCAIRVPGDHAGQTETSLMLHLVPLAVDMSALKPGDFWYNWTPGDLSQDGSAELGRRYFDAMVDGLAKLIGPPAG